MSDIEVRISAIQDAIDVLIPLQAAVCCYMTVEGDGRSCDCKFAGGRGGSEVTGCAEYRTAIRKLKELIQEEQSV